MAIAEFIFAVVKIIVLIYVIAVLVAGYSIFISMPKGVVRILSAIGFCLLALGFPFISFQRWINSGHEKATEDDRKFTEEFRPHALHFESLCRSAGTKVFSTAENVHTIALQAPRGNTTPDDLKDPKFKGDVYGAFDVESSESAERRLVETYLTKKEWEELWYVPTQEIFLRYPQVEIPAEHEGKQGFYRYLDTSVGSYQKFSKTFVEIPESRYYVKWEDISTPQDREHWIAGSKWSIIDLKSGAVMAERIGYAIDLAQGRTQFGTSGAAGSPALPWIRAGHVQYNNRIQSNSCPVKTELHNLDFVRSVLKPEGQEMKVIPRPVR